MIWGSHWERINPLAVSKGSHRYIGFRVIIYLFLYKSWCCWTAAKLHSVVVQAEMCIIFQTSGGFCQWIFDSLNSWFWKHFLDEVLFILVELLKYRQRYTKICRKPSRIKLSNVFLCMPKWGDLTQYCHELPFLKPFWLYQVIWIQAEEESKGILLSWVQLSMTSVKVEEPHTHIDKSLWSHKGSKWYCLGHLLLVHMQSECYNLFRCLGCVCIETDIDEHCIWWLCTI